jgi:hypothetical protein
VTCFVIEIEDKEVKLLRLRGRIYFYALTGVRLCDCVHDPNCKNNIYVERTHGGAGNYSVVMYAPTLNISYEVTIAIDCQ